MEILKGLTSKQIAVIRHCSSHRDITAGDTIFLEGEPAYGLFVIISGKVEIYKKTLDGEIILNTLGPNQVFGEMGLLSQSAARTASARAVERTLLFEMRDDPVKMFHDAGEDEGALRLLKNLVCLLGHWLRQKNRAGSPRPNSPVVYRPAEGYEADPEAAADVVRSHLPKGLFRKLPTVKRLPADTVLFHQGDEPDGFYFIHEGDLDVIVEDTGGPRTLERLHGPTVVGEIGCFTGEPRSATIVAATDVACTFFSGDDYKKLEKKKPDEALELLHAAAQLVVHLICEREGSATLG